MASMISLRRSPGMLGLAAVAVIAVGLQAGPAQAGSVGPKQYFTGVINGKDGNTTKPITITMNCPGPLQPGQTGHPLAGQTLAVHQLFPPASGTLGRTGNDAEIGVFFAAPPGAAQASPSHKPHIYPLRQPQVPAYLAHPALLRDGQGLVHPDPGGPPVPVGRRPRPLHGQALSGQILRPIRRQSGLEGAQTWVRWDARLASRGRRSWRSGGSAGGLDERLPRGPGSLRRAAWAGLQDSMPRAALLSIHARVEGTGPSTWEDPSLVQLWGPRFNVFVVAARDLAVFSLGTLPDDAKGRRRAEDLAARLQRRPRRRADALRAGGPRARRAPQQPQVRGSDRHGRDPVGRRAAAGRSGPCRHRRPTPATPAWNSRAGTCTSTAPPRPRPSAGGRGSAGGTASRRSRRSARR